jgi:hypothetical protein
MEHSSSSLLLDYHLVKEIEIFENQRWVPGGKDFSRNNLLPTDRKGYSVGIVLFPQNSR